MPPPEFVQQAYKDNKNAAYWAQVWPAAIGLSMFLQQHQEYIADQRVLELAAGLGLPGLYAASVAKEVTISDKEVLASAYVKRSAAQLQLNNVTATTLDWKDAIAQPWPDVVLLSDVNYEPEVFAELKKVIDHFLQHKVTVIISTPQRLVAKPFIITLLPCARQQWNSTVTLNDVDTEVSVFVLRQAQHDKLGTSSSL
ncbi:Lysine methyltransferase [Niabella drilacis]|uniref:Lysine methyltransferase n=2 Tax=Niabella drilacis (strain DSM 25811 / CCM 8410 / CCUG 62505 / LMG 26954 / E90) TaxID=1285928 RepID=A0A1G6XU80_NIADE|nr:Lysine methyltransferase [Niabella drilacis]